MQNCENVVRVKKNQVYFECLAKQYKPSSLWLFYSVLRSVMSVVKNVDISEYSACLNKKSGNFDLKIERFKKRR